jgi:hypothetical protein
MIKVTSTLAETDRSERACGLLERLGLVSCRTAAQADRDEMALIAARGWTVARGDLMLRRFL